MPVNRTSCEAQVAAVARLIKENPDPTLRDAVKTLVLVKQMVHECQRDQPDIDKVSALIMNLVTGS